MTLVSFLAKLSLLSTESGGRRHPIGTDYRAGLFFDVESNSGNDGVVTLIDQERCFPGEECVARIRPLVPELVEQFVRPGSIFEVREGRRVIGHGTVLAESR